MSTDREKIDALGGVSALAKKIGYSPQRIQNWRTRGIPASVKLEFPELFLTKGKSKADLSGLEA